MTWLYWLLAGWFVLSLGMAAGWSVFRRDFRDADTPPVFPEVAERRARVYRTQAQIDAERARTGRDIVTDAAVRTLHTAPLPPRTDT